MMDPDADSDVPDRPMGLTESRNQRIRIADRLRSWLVPIGLYLLFGFILVIAYGIWPDTIPKWLLAVVFAPILLFLGEALGELVFRVIGAPFMLLAKVPPFSWLAWWLRCEDGEGDPVLRFAGLAFGLLAVSLFALKIIFPE